MKAGPLASKRKGRQEIGMSDSVAAPVKGWNTRDPLANMDPRCAVILDNWLPSTGTVELRPGVTDHATGLGTAVKALMPWRGTASQKLFASTDSGIYDVTAAGAIGAVVQARTNGSCIGINFNTTGQSYLVTVNGVDDLAYTNGTTWTTLANFSITGGGTLLTKDIVNVNNFKRSLYFLKKASLSFFYLPIDSITGIVSEFPLGALFSRGGYLMAMGTWTIDGGFGADDYAVFISSEGQAVVYKGTDPSSTTTWALNGVYDLSPPMGRKCFCRFGGDLLVLTRRGVFSMSRILKDTMMTPNSALSDIVGEAFSAAAVSGGSYLGWDMTEYPDKNLLICNIPQVEFTNTHQYIMNTKTNAWCRFKGWDGFCVTMFGNTVYMGFGGKVGKIFIPGNDFASSITAEAQAAFNYHSPHSRLKRWGMIRANLTLGGSVAVNVALKTDFQEAVDYGTAVFNTSLLSRWDSSQWDTAGWSTEPTGHNEWVTVATDDSYASAVCLRVIARDATVTWSATDQLYEPGALV
jgi:hypothetical protein